MHHAVSLFVVQRTDSVVARRATVRATAPLPIRAKRCLRAVINKYYVIIKTISIMTTIIMNIVIVIMQIPPLRAPAPVAQREDLRGVDPDGGPPA